MKTFVCRFYLAVILILSGFLVSSPACSQQVPNAGFEDWSMLSLFKEPQGLLTTNLLAYLTTGQPNVTRTNDALFGNYAIRFETVSNGADIVPGGINIGNFGPGGFTGGIPYTDHPGQIAVAGKWNLIPGDTARIYVIFKNMGVPVGTAYYSFSGNWVGYNLIFFDVFWTPGATPDSVMLAFYCSTPDAVTAAGSVFIMDSLQMVAVSQQIPNNSFENWYDISSEEPDSWATSNLLTLYGSGTSVEKSTDAYEGSYSARLTNRLSIGGDTISFLTNGEIGEEGPAGGTPVSGNPASFSFYYKYAPVGPDTALALGILWRNDGTVQEMLDSVMLKLPPQEIWTYEQLDFNYTGSPPADTLTLAFSAGNISEDNLYIGYGSELKIDRLELDYGSPGIINPISQPSAVFPNPATENIFVQGNPGQIIRVQILSLDGQLLKYFEILSGTKTSVSDLQPGCYLYRIIKGGVVARGKLVII